jgi:rod shape-determining protein MreD
VSGAVALRASLLVFVAAMVQTVVVPPFVVGSGAPDLLLVVVVSLGLLRGSIAGAVFGFGGGLIVDTLMLDTLGVTSLVLTLAGFWAGRYAETTGRGRASGPIVAVGAITVLAGVFVFLLHFLLGEEVVARTALVSVLVPTLALNLLLALPVHALVRSVVGDRMTDERPAGEVEVVV